MEPGGYLTTGERRPTEYEKKVFQLKLETIGADPELLEAAMGGLPERFTSTELDAALDREATSWTYGYDRGSRTRCGTIRVVNRR